MSSSQDPTVSTNTTAPVARRLSGVGIAASRFSQRVSTVLKPALSNPIVMGSSTTTTHPPQATAQAGPSLLVPKTATVPPASGGPAVDTILDQLRYYQKEGFTPPRVFSGGKRIAVCDVQVLGTSI